MGKTYRYDSDSGEKTGKKSKRKLKTAPETIGVPSGLKSAKEELTEVKVRKMIHKPVEQDLRRLVENGVMLPQDSEHWSEYIADKVCALLPKFDPNHIGKNGKRISASTYFIGAALKYTLHVCRYLGQKKRQAVIVSISDKSPEDAKLDGDVSVECLSDECRSVRELEFKMDVETMRMMLGQEERVVLEMLMEEYTHEEIAAKLGCRRLRVTRTLVPHIQNVARACGFIPQSEIRVMERAKKDK